jgi:hypothetical protein
LLPFAVRLTVRLSGLGYGTKAIFMVVISIEWAKATLLFIFELPHALAGGIIIQSPSLVLAKTYAGAGVK